MRTDLTARLVSVVLIAFVVALLVGGALIADEIEDPILPTGGSGGLAIDVKDSLDPIVIADSTMTADDDSTSLDTESIPSE